MSSECGCGTSAVGTLWLPGLAARLGMSDAAVEVAMLENRREGYRDREGQPRTRSSRPREGLAAIEAMLAESH